MFEISELSDDFEKMLFDIVSNHMFFPIDKDRLVYKKYLVSRSKDGWLIEQKHRNLTKLIAKTFLKSSAFAVCKLHERNRFTKIEEIKGKDSVFKKHYIDSQHYKRTYNRTKDSLLKDTVLWRYEISHNTAKSAKQFIDKEFYSLLR